MIVLRPDDYEPYPRSARTGSNDVARQRWSEVQEQALPGAENRLVQHRFCKFVFSSWLRGERGP